MCYDAEGSTSTMQASIERGRLLTQGVAPAEIERRVEQDYNNGNLHAPRKAGLVYMLSAEGDWRDPKDVAVHHHVIPHIMVYAPYIKNADIGVLPEHAWSTTHVWVQYEGKADAYMIFEVGPTWASH